MRQLDQVYDQLPIISFEKRQALHDWLLANEQTSPGIWIRIFKAKSKSPSVTFHEVLEEGLCFGWSESMLSYLQKFTPRKGKSTQSERNLRLVDKLAAENRMRPSGYSALGLKPKN